MSEYGFFIAFFLVLVFLAITQDEEGRGYFAQFASSTPASTYGSTLVVPDPHASATAPPQEVSPSVPYIPVPSRPVEYLVTLSTGEELLVTEAELQELLATMEVRREVWH